MNPEYTFSVGSRINVTIPELHTRSVEAARETMQPGDFIEIGIERIPKTDGENPLLVESVFARVEAINWPFIDAIVHSQVRFTKFHGVNSGDIVSCESKQILSWLSANDPKAAGLIAYSDEMVEISREFLVELSIADISQDCFLRCILNEMTTVVIGRMDSGTVGAIVGLVAVEPEVCADVRTEASWYQAAFVEATARLGITFAPVGELGAAGRNSLVVGIELTATGQDLIDLVFATIERIHQEVKRFRAEQLSQTDKSAESAQS